MARDVYQIFKLARDFQNSRKLKGSRILYSVLVFTI
jgi:hypothetical protein